MEALPIKLENGKLKQFCDDDTIPQGNLGIFNHLFVIFSAFGGVYAKTRAYFNSVPQDGMFTMNINGYLTSVSDPSLITDDPYFEEDPSNIGYVRTKNLI
jgi:hypothetical protein